MHGSDPATNSSLVNGNRRRHGLRVRAEAVRTAELSRRTVAPRYNPDQRAGDVEDCAAAISVARAFAEIEFVCRDRSVVGLGGGRGAQPRNGNVTSAAARGSARPAFVEPPADQSQGLVRCHGLASNVEFTRRHRTIENQRSNVVPADERSIVVDDCLPDRRGRLIDGRFLRSREHTDFARRTIGEKRPSLITPERERPVLAAREQALPHVREAVARREDDP